jgi:hypothetical protein
MMLLTQKLSAIAAIAYVLTTQVAATPDSKSIVKEQLHIEKQRREVAQQQAEKTIDAMPSWAANVPRPDGTGVYALGIAESDKVQIALKKAQLQAEYGLAKLYNQELSG